MPQNPGLPAGSPSRVFFTADHHFGHRNIIGLCQRPFADIEEMDAALVANWNAVVGQGDVVYHLGDFCRGGSDTAARYLARLNGRVHLIHGNHDKPGVQQMKQWASSTAFTETVVEDQRLVLFHYAMRTCRGVHWGSLHLFGHSHGRMPGDRQSLDVGVDCWGYRPVSLEEIKARMATLPERACRRGPDLETE